MQQSGKKWIIIVSILLAAVLFVLFIPYGKDAAVYRLTKKYISRYYYQKPSSVAAKGGTVGANNDCVWLRLEINGYPERLWIDNDGSVRTSDFGVGTDSWFNRTDEFNISKVNRLLWLSYYDAINASNDAGESTAFIEFMLSAIKASLIDAIHTSDTMSDGKMDKKTLRWQKIEQFLQTHEYIMNADVRELCGVSAATANRILAGSVKDGKLSKRQEENHWAYKINL